VRTEPVNTSCRRHKTSKFLFISFPPTYGLVFVLVLRLRFILNQFLIFIVFLSSLQPDIEDQDHRGMASHIGVRPVSGVRQIRQSITTPPEGPGYKRRRLLSPVSTEEQPSVGFLKDQNKALHLHLEQVQKTVFVLTNAMVSKREADRVKKLESELNALKSQFQSQAQLAAADVDYCLLHVDPAIRESVQSLLPSKNVNNGFG
jgi:hypothetical protein